MTTGLREMTLQDALIVCADMRPEDRDCVRAMCGCEPGEWFAVDRWKTDGPAWVLEQDGQPWCIGGLSFSNAWSGVLWLVARPGMRAQTWRKVMRAARMVLEVMDPAHPLHRHRVEALVLESWQGAQALADRLGLVLEGTRRAMGSNRESVQMRAAVRA